LRKREAVKCTSVLGKEGKKVADQSQEFQLLTKRVIGSS